MGDATDAVVDTAATIAARPTAEAAR